MNKKILLLISTVAATLLLSACGGENKTTSNTDSSPSNAPTLSSAYVDSLKIKLASASAAPLSSSPRKSSNISEDVSLGDIMFLLTIDEKASQELDDIYDNSEPRANLFYDYFKAKYVDTDIVSANEKLAFENMSIQDFSRYFMYDYFTRLPYKAPPSESPFTQSELDGPSTSFINMFHPNVAYYMGSDLHEEAGYKESVALFLMGISFDYAHLINDYMDVIKGSFVSEEMRDAVVYLRSQYLNYHKVTSNVNRKICAHLSNDSVLGQKIFSAFSDEHEQYFTTTLDSTMYTCMVNDIAKGNVLGQTLSRSFTFAVLFNEYSLVIPNEDGLDAGQDAFAKLFFDVGTTERGDANELTTEKLQYALNLFVEKSFFLQSRNHDFLAKIALLEEDRKEAYLDFLYLGENPVTQERDTIQAHYFSYARSAALEASALRLDQINQRDSEIIDNGVHSFIITSWLTLHTKYTRFSDIYTYIPYSRYIPYTFEYVKSTYYYFSNDLGENDEQLQGYILDTLVFTTDSTDSNVTSASVARSSFATDALNSVTSSASEWFSSYALSDDMPKVDKTNLFSNESATIVNYIKDADENWIVDISEAGYTHVNLYNSDEKWQYLPIEISTLDYLRLDETTGAFSAEFNFASGFVYVYMLSSDDLEKVQTLVANESLETVPSDTIYSSNENTSYTLYRMKVIPNDILDFGQLTSSLDAIFFDSSKVIYIPQ